MLTSEPEHSEFIEMRKHELNHSLTFEVLMMMKVIVIVFWIVTPCSDDGDRMNL
jgi:hypothetical protein